MHAGREHIRQGIGLRRFAWGMGRLLALVRPPVGRGTSQQTQGDMVAIYMLCLASATGTHLDHSLSAAAAGAAGSSSGAVNWAALVSGTPAACLLVSGAVDWSYPLLPELKS